VVISHILSARKPADLRYKKFQDFPPCIPDEGNDSMSPLKKRKLYSPWRGGKL
jgi:hypothetical protein